MIIKFVLYKLLVSFSNPHLCHYCQKNMRFHLVSFSTDSNDLSSKGTETLDNVL